MNEPTRLILVYAASDLRMAEMAIQDNPILLAHQVYWHCQQAAEKAMKAALYSRELQPTKTHALLSLLKWLTELDPAWAPWKEDCLFLMEYGAGANYPDALHVPSYTSEMLERAQGIVAFTRTWIDGAT